MAIKPATKPTERKLQILQTIAEMLESPAGEKVTTAALAAKLDVSEAALYRHFASKAQMYEGLIEFIETSVFSVLNQIAEGEESGLKQVELMLTSLLRFAQKNRGLTRVLVGDALVHENPRLQVRINQLLDRIGATLKQCLKVAATQGTLPAEHDFTAHADLLVCYVAGRWLRFVKGGFREDPLALWAGQWPLLA
ncbi:MAG: nucleoid occlusion factor SlmA [Rhodocyclaceae bacterium]|nr:nucleoid occlusion factor SlmA [Rhodocyclaceae bacterium]